MVIDNARKGVPLLEIVEGLSQDAVVIPSNLNVRRYTFYSNCEELLYLSNDGRHD
jgi:hypothetical protein